MYSETAAATNVFVNLAQVFQALTEAHLRVKIEKMLSSDFSWSLQLLPEIYQGFLKDC